MKEFSLRQTPEAHSSSRKSKKKSLQKLRVKFVSGFASISYFHVHFKTALTSEAEIL